MINKEERVMGAQSIIQAASIYVAQLRGMMAPMFCTVSVLSHLSGAKNKFKQAVETNLGSFNAREQAHILDLMEQMLDIHVDELAGKLPLIAKKQNELKLLFTQYRAQ